MSTDVEDANFAVASGKGKTTSFGGVEIAGHTIKGQGEGELLVLGDGTMLVKLLLKEGFNQDGHDHPDHESIGYILSGRVRMQVGEETSELGPGATWYHPKGVRHTCLALEDAEILEFHAPRRPDVLGLFGLR